MNEQISTPSEESIPTTYQDLEPGYPKITESTGVPEPTPETVSGSSSNYGYTPDYNVSYETISLNEAIDRYDYPTSPVTAQDLGWISGIAGSITKPLTLPTNSVGQLDEFLAREKAIQYTIQIYGTSEVSLDDFATVLEKTYNWLTKGKSYKA